MKKFISLLLAVVMVFGAVAVGISGLDLVDIGIKAEATTSGTYGDNITWSLNEITGELIITGTGDMDGCGWAADAPWYSYHEKITKVVIENGVTNIVGYAFWCCENLADITIPNSVTHIGTYAFYECDSLTKVTISANVTSIGISPFAGCEKLEKISVEENNENYSSDENGVLFNKNMTDLIQYPGGSEITAYSIPYGVTNINSYAFMECKNLKEVNIPYGVKNIGMHAFNNCINLNQIAIPRSVSSIGMSAFYCCNSLGDVYYIGTVEEWNAIKIRDYNTCLTNATIYYNHSPEYTFTLNANGGHFDDGSSLYTIGYKFGDDIPSSDELPIPSKEGYEFADWNETIPVTMPEHDITYIAQWKEILPETYTVTYKYGGSVPANAAALPFYHECKAGEIVTVCDTPVLEGYVFNGWYVNGNLVDDFVMPECDVEVIGWWEAVNYNAVFDANGGNWIDGTTIKTYEISYGSTIVPPEEDPEKENGIFMGWADKRGNGEIIADFGNMEFGAEYVAVWKSTEHIHNPQTVTISATCTVAGMEYEVCEFCGNTIGEARVIPAKGHIPGDWVVILEPTAETNGKRIKKCTVCGETVVEEDIFKKIVVKDENTDISIEINSGEYGGEVDIIVEEFFDGVAYNLVNTETGATKNFIYDIRMTVDGEEVQPTGRLTVKIPLPEGYNPSQSFVYHVDTATPKVENMNARYENGYLIFETGHFSYYAVVEKTVVSINISTPSTTTISYGDSIILHADASNIPAGGYVVWTASNGNFSYSASDDGLTCRISPESSGSTTFTATIYDANDNALSSDTQEMTSKAGFFDKLVAFFKRLFGLTKTIPEMFRTIL